MEMIAEFAAHPEKMKYMNDRKFEEMIVELYDAFGFSVSLTGKTRDGGIDIIAAKSSEKQLYLIECKRHEKKIDLRTIQRLYSVLKLNKGTKAILATTSHLTAPAMGIIESHRWELGKKDYDDLLEMISTYKRLKNI